GRAQDHLGVDLLDARDVREEPHDLLFDQRSDRTAHGRQGVGDVHGLALDVDAIDEPEIDDVDAELGVVHVAQRIHDLIADAVKAAKELDPDIVFMDVRMPGMNGIEATKAIRENDPNAKVILFTVEESQASVGDAIRAGVAGYLLKDSSAGELIHAAKRAQEGGAVIAPALTRKFIEEAEFIHQPHEDVTLSPRE